MVTRAEFLQDQLNVRPDEAYAASHPPTSAHWVARSRSAEPSAAALSRPRARLLAII